MDKKKDVVFASVTSPSGEDIHRSTLREAFAQFGSIRKIFVPTGNSTYAKVYFDDPEVTQRACSDLNGVNNWNVEVGGDGCKTFDRNTRIGYSRNSQHFDLNNSFGAHSDTGNNSSNCDDMGENFVGAGEYVDLHGRPVEVLQSDQMQLFVNLDDVRSAGFHIFPKERFYNATISKDMEIREFENYLLSQGMKYILNFKKTFDENEMVRVFEKVKARLQNPEPAPHAGLNRQVTKLGNNKNFSVTAKTTAYSSPQPNQINLQTPATNNQAHNRPPKLSPGNFQSSNRSFQDRPTFNSGKNELWRERNAENYAGKPQNGSINNSKLAGRSTRSDEFIPKQNALMQTTHQPAKQFDDGGKTITALAPKTDRASNASVANKDPTPVKIERLPLALSSIHKINISYVNPNKPNLFYGQKIETLRNIDDILLHVNTVDNTLPEVTPTKNMLCVAFFEDIWYRAVVLNSSPADTFVELIDYGNREHITTPVREMSAQMKAIPAQANRFTVESKQLSRQSFTFETGQQFEVFTTKEFDDSTCLIQIRAPLNTNKVDEEQKVAPASPSSELPRSLDSDKRPQEYFTELPDCTAKLLPDESVMIVNYIDTQLVLRNKDTGGICKKVYDHLSKMEMKSVDMPKLGQLVLCAKDTREDRHRAIIKEINEKIVEVEFVDYYGGDFASVKSLCNVDATLASYPRAALTLEYPVLSQISEEAEDFLNHLILQKKKLKAIKADKNIDLMLVTENILLSEKLKQLSEPKPAPKSVSPRQEAEQGTQKSKLESDPTLSVPVTHANVPMKQPEKTNTPDPNYIEVNYSDMPFLNAPVGLAPYCCYSCQDGMVTIISTSEKNEAYLAEILVVEEPDDQSSYVPAEFVMCLAKFQDAWYRAFVAENHDDQIAVFFVDFGNTELIDKSEIRRFPKRLAEIPLLGITAAFSGIPDAPNVHKRLTELIPDESILEVDVKQSSDDEFKCKIEIPCVYNKLRQEGLI